MIVSRDGEDSRIGGAVTIVGDDRYALIVQPADRQRALLQTIARARDSLRLVYYIFASDGIGTTVRDALLDAVERGVTVSLIVDGFGSASTPASFFEPLRHAGAFVCRFLPRYGRRYLFRNHQKMVIADRHRALIGGFNIEDSYFAEPEDGGWCDLALTLEGSAVARLVTWFDVLENWTRTPNARMRSLGRALVAASDATGRVRWLLSGPMRRLTPLTRGLKAELRNVRQLDIVSAYFSPNYGMLRRIGRVVRRGGSVRLIGAGKSDNGATVAAWRHCLHGLLARGVRTFEFDQTKLHMKLVVADDAVWIGSANFDMRSLYLNLEVMLRIEDAALAWQARTLIDRLAEQSTAITSAVQEARSTWLQRFRWTFAYFVVATVDTKVTGSLFRLDE